MYKFLFILLFGIISGFSYSQNIQISTSDTPQGTTIEACTGGEVTITFSIIGGPLDDGTIEITTPPGVTFQSISAASITTGTATINGNIIELQDADGTGSFTYSRTTDCTVVSPLIDAYTVSVGTAVDLTYNVDQPSLTTLVSYDPSDNVQPGETTTRCISFTNAGFGNASFIQLTDEFPSGMVIDPLSVTSSMGTVDASLDAGTLTVNLTDIDFANGDAPIEICYDITVDGCDGNDPYVSTILQSWGCDENNLCETKGVENTNGQHAINVDNSAVPLVVVTETTIDQSSCFEDDDIYTITYTNNGEGAATNLFAEFSGSSGGNPVNTGLAYYDIEAIQITTSDGSHTMDSANITGANSFNNNNHTCFSGTPRFRNIQFVLQDANGDPLVLEPGESVTVQVVRNICINACTATNTTIQQPFYQLEYSDSCGNPRTTIEQDTSGSLTMSYFWTNSPSPTDVSESTPFNLAFNYGALLRYMNDDDDPYNVTYEMILPPGFVPPSCDAALFSGIPADATNIVFDCEPSAISGDGGAVSVSFDTSDTTLNDESPFQINNLTLDCEKVTSANVVVTVNHYVQPDPDCEEVLLACRDFPLAVHCPICLEGGLINEGFTMTRTNIDTPDLNNDGTGAGTVADIENLYNNSRIIAGDIVQAELIGSVQGPGSWTTGHLLVEAGSVESQFAYESATIEINGVEYPINNTAPNQNINGTTASQIDWSTANIVGGPTEFLPGDEIIVRVNYIALSNQDRNANFIHNFSTDFYLTTSDQPIGSVPNDPSQTEEPEDGPDDDKDSCDSYNAAIEQFPISLFNQSSQRDIINGCNSVLIENGFRLDVAPFNPRNAFPYEIRQPFVMEKLRIVLPPGFDLDIVTDLPFINYSTGTETGNIDVPFTQIGPGEYEFDLTITDDILHDRSFIRIRYNINAECDTEATGGFVDIEEYWTLGYRDGSGLDNDIVRAALLANTLPNQNFILELDDEPSPVFNEESILYNAFQVAMSGSGTSQTAYGTSVTWPDVTLTNTSAFNQAVPNAYLVIEDPTGSFSNILVDGQAPNANGFYEVGNILRGGANAITQAITADLENCSQGELIVKFGYDCNAIPIDPETACFVEELPLIVNPAASDAQITVSSLANTPADPSDPTAGNFTSGAFCSQFPVELTIRAVELGDVNDIIANYNLPTGTTYVANSAHIEYEGVNQAVGAAAETIFAASGTGGTISAPLADMLPTSFGSDEPLPGLFNQTGGNNEFIIRFLVETGCDTSEGARGTASLNANQYCGDPIPSDGVTRVGYQIDYDDVEPGYNAFMNPNIAINDLTDCSIGTEIEVDFDLGGDPTSSDLIRVTLPASVEYDPMSCVGCPDDLEPIITTGTGGITILEWPMPTGSMTNDTVNFTFTALPKSNDLTCTTEEVSIEVLSEQGGLVCNGEPCDAIQVINGSETYEMVIDGPVLAISDVEVEVNCSAIFENQGEAPITVDFNLTNTGSDYSPVDLPYVLFNDVDGDGAYDANVDTALASDLFTGLVSASGNPIPFSLDISEPFADVCDDFCSMDVLLAFIDPCDCGTIAPQNIVCSILPIELASFNAIAEEESTVLNWISETELNSSHFIVQRSLDGINFDAVSDPIAAAGNSFNQISYSYIDKEAAVFTNGDWNYNVYYRLKMVDIDNTFEYSEIRLVNFEHFTIETKLFPNPVLSGDSFVIQSDQIQKIEVHSSTGQVIYQQEFDQAVRSSSIDASEWSVGNYYIRINEGEHVLKLVRIE